MKFSEFFDSVCLFLNKNHNWKSPKTHLMSKTDYLDVVYHGYRLALIEECDNGECDWHSYSRKTSFEVNQQESMVTAI